MNMLLHGVENPDIRYRDSLAQDHAGEEEKYTLVLANPPFAGSLDYENTAKDLQQIVKTKKTELLFLALFLRLLKPGGRAAVIVPDGVLFGSSNAHKDAAQDARRGPEARRRHLAARRRVQALRRRLHRDPPLHQDQLRRHGPRLVLRRGRRRHVASTTNARRLLPPEKLGPVPKVALTADEHAKNNLPDVLARWAQRDGKPSAERPRTAQSFCVPKADIAAQGYDLSLNRYKEVVHEEVEHRPPSEILADLGKLEAEIQQGMKELEGMLK